MVICRPVQLQTFTFLDEAEDQLEGDWEVDPDDVEGWPQEIYECMEHLMWEGLGDCPDDRPEFSENLISTTKELIEKYKLTEEMLLQKCVKTRITHADGTTRFLYVSPERLANAMFDFDLGVEHTGSIMLHLDDECGDHSVFLSLSQISRIELPLLTLKEGLKNEEHYTDDEESATDLEAANAKSPRTPRPNKK